MKPPFSQVENNRPNLNWRPGDAEIERPDFATCHRNSIVSVGRQRISRGIGDRLRPWGRIAKRHRGRNDRGGELLHRRR